MNTVLASIYGTGLAKTASAADEDLDLNNISAAQLLELLADEGEPEKVANEEEVDLSKMTAAELIQLVEQADAVDAEEAEKVAFEAMVEDGSFDYFDRAGRILAHAYADEMGKVANSDEIDVNLDEITGEQLMELMEQGYEFVQDEGAEKVAKSSKSELLSRLGEAFTKKTGRTPRGLALEAGMKGRHYAGKAGKHLKENKGKYVAGGAAAASLPAGLAAYKMRKKKKD